MPRGRRGPQERPDIQPEIVSDHGIRAADIHSNVLFVCRRLRDHGHIAFVVGGAVRDLLLGRVPKDFDLATSARPETVKALFRNARIIGRRFKLAQLRYPNMAMEVATFRSAPRNDARGMILRDNRYGTAEEDVRRRDFTINALTYDPIDNLLYDYVGGLADLKAKRIRTIRPAPESFREDPVRMMRAVRFKVRLGFVLDKACEQAIVELAPLIADVKRHRLAEEMQRFLTRGNAEAAYGEFDRLGLLKPLLGLDPHAWFFPKEARAQPLERLAPYLRSMDAWVASGGEAIAPTVALLGLLTALGADGMRTWLRNREDRSDRAFDKLLSTRLAGMLADWGLLNGQVVPALSILEAARAVGAQEGALLWEPEAAARFAGIREALLLLAVLAPILDVPPTWVRQGKTLLPRLPDLPILDHPRPANRGSAARGTAPHRKPKAVARKRRSPRNRSAGRTRRQRSSAQS